MGMYTELYLGTKLSGDTPPEVFALIEQAIEGRHPLANLPDHPFFECERWSFIFCGGGSYYFEAPCFQRLFEPDPICDGARQLLIVVNIKNYAQEIQHFLDWIGPYIAEGGHVGHMRYEEEDVPTLLELPWDWEHDKAAGPIQPMAAAAAKGEA